MSIVVAAGPVIPNFGQGSSCVTGDHTFCWDWVQEHWGDTLQPARGKTVSVAQGGLDDNGAGIAPEVKDKMFNPFFTTKPAGEGTGLGLSICHDIIVKQHGGRIEVEIEPGRFTEFKIVLPRTVQR